MNYSIEKYLVRYCRVLIFLVFVLTVIGYAGSSFYLFDIFSFFRVQYFCMSIVFLILAVWLIKFSEPYKYFIGLAVVCVVLNGFEILPWMHSSNPVSAKKSSVKILLSNVLTSNPLHFKAVNILKQNKPDIVVLEETNKDWLKSFRTIEKVYKYSVKVPRNDNFGIALYSKYPLINTKVDYWGSSYKKPVILTNIKLNGKIIKIAAVHPTPPKNPECFNSRNLTFERLSRWVKSDKTPTIVIGDMNASMFSPSYKRLVRASSLANSRQGYGLYPSWSVVLPEFLRVSIDNILYSKDFSVQKFRTLSSIGSDHLPVYAELSIK